MKKIDLFFMTIISVSLLQYCSQREPYTISYNGDVKEIMNYKPLYGEEEVYSLELQHVYGGPDDKEGILGQPADVVKDSKGNIFIFSKSDLNIKKYDKVGNFIMTFGRSGNGPGEYQYFQSMQINQEDNLYIHEMMSGRLQKITNEGQYVDEYKLPIFAVWFIILDNEKVVFSKFNDVTDEEKAAILHVSNYDEDIMYSFCKPKILEDVHKTRRFNFIWCTKDHKNNIIVNFLYQNRIEKYDQSGELIFRTKRKLNYKIFFEKEGENVFEVAGKKVKIPAYKSNIVSGFVVIDDENNIWVLTYLKQKSEGDSQKDITIFEVYNNDGILLTQVPVPVHGIYKIYQNCLFIIDSIDTGAVYEYRIIKKL